MQNASRMLPGSDFSEYPSVLLTFQNYTALQEGAIKTLPNSNTTYKGEKKVEYSAPPGVNSMNSVLFSISSNWFIS